MELVPLACEDELAIDNFTIVLSLCSRASRFMHYRMLVKMLITFEPHQNFSIVQPLVCKKVTRLLGGSKDIASVQDDAT